jgi:hypothetical protein
MKVEVKAEEPEQEQTDSREKRVAQSKDETSEQ